MKLKNKEIKKLFDAVELYFDMVSLPSVMTSFMECDDAIEGEIAALKAELHDANVSKDIIRGNAECLKSIALERGDELRKAKNQIASLKEDLKTADARFEAEKKTINGLVEENSDLENELIKAKRLEENYHRLALDLYEERNRLREVVDVLEKEINTLKKKIHELEKENANLRVTPTDANAIEALKEGNRVLRRDNNKFLLRIEELEEELSEERDRAETLMLAHSDAVADNKRLKEAYDIHEETIERLKMLLAQRDEIEALKKENSKLITHNEDLSYNHNFEFGDKVFVPWSDVPYMYVKTSLMYNPRTKSLVYVGKTEHLKWFGEKFEIK